MWFPERLENTPLTKIEVTRAFVQIVLSGILSVFFQCHRLRPHLQQEKMWVVLVVCWPFWVLFVIFDNFNTKGRKQHYKVIFYNSIKNLVHNSNFDSLNLLFH